MEWLILGLIILTFILTVIMTVKRKKQARTKFFLLIALLSAAACIWYFIPVHYRLPDADKLEIKVCYHADGTERVITDYNQKREICDLIGELLVMRPFFYRNINTLGDRNFVFLLLYSKEKVTKNDFHLELCISLNEKGFFNKNIYCFDFRDSLVLNPQKLIAYLKSLQQQVFI